MGSKGNLKWEPFVKLLATDPWLKKGGEGVEPVMLTPFISSLAVHTATK